MATAIKQQTMKVETEVRVEPCVVVTSDVDCDGIGYGYHRVLVPLTLSRDAGSAMWFAVVTDQMSGYGDACEVLTEEKFKARAWDEMTEFERSYWEGEGYHGVFYRR